MSPSVVLDQKYEMLHVPVKEIVQDASIAKERIVEGRNVCGIHFTNGDAFAVASVMNCEEKSWQSAILKVEKNTRTDAVRYWRRLRNPGSRGAKMPVDG